jgi:hypothetical protein
VAGEPAVVLLASGAHHPSYQLALRALADDGVPFLVGGALAMAVYAGVGRCTKDLDLFVIERDVPRVLAALARTGFAHDVSYPHWLAKMRWDEARSVDVIFNSGNGVARVDEGWFANATGAIVFGVPAALCPVEETLWCKAFVMERERFDGADVLHLLLACAATLDWDRLLHRFGEHWRVLYAHLVLFGYAFPDEAARIPAWVMKHLEERVRSHGTHPPGARVCRGTLLSREQYIADLERGWQDGRLGPPPTMSPEAIATWTAAIDERGTKPF